MKTIIGRLYFIIILFVSVSFLYSSNNITVALDDYRPLNYLVDEKLQGPSVDIVKLLFKEINEKENIIYLPWKRGYETTQTKVNFALASTTRTYEREKLFKW
ncbi:MAG: transporter substrate-binding domain-containing protein, partial [Campylobacteraceae bacterium]|nr:transporter substrate-binding domain-containing protein [Campylobacteraceae bacterium]